MIEFYFGFTFCWQNWNFEILFCYARIDYICDPTHQSQNRIKSNQSVLTTLYWHSNICQNIFQRKNHSVPKLLTYINLLKYGACIWWKFKRHSCSVRMPLENSSFLFLVNITHCNVNNSIKLPAPPKATARLPSVVVVVVLWSWSPSHWWGPRVETVAQCHSHQPLDLSTQIIKWGIKNLKVSFCIVDTTIN